MKRGGRGVLLEVAEALRAGDRYDVGPLSEHPGEGELRRLDALLGGDRLDPFDGGALPG